MKKKSLVLKLSMVLFCLLFLTFGCGKRTYIDVTYKIPEKNHALDGQKIFLEVKDNRSNKNFFNEKAKEKFKYFTGVFSLTTMNENDNKTFEGAFDLQSLFETALKKRFESMGVKITPEKSDADLVFQITLYKFDIGRDGRKWESHVSYKANLIKDGRIIAKETISGTAERISIMGSTSSAETVISDIFTEIINSLNIQGLFDQAMH